MIRIVNSTESPMKESIKEKDIKKIDIIQDFLNEHGVYIVASVDGEGVHLGRFKKIGIDANGHLTIDCDIDGISSIG